MRNNLRAKTKYTIRKISELPPAVFEEMKRDYTKYCTEKMALCSVPRD